MANEDQNPSELAAAYDWHSVEVVPELDPELQLLILTRPALPDTHRLITKRRDGDILVDVIAKLHKESDVVDGLEVVQHIGKIVTGTVKTNDIENVRRQVFSLKAARLLNRALSRSVFDIEATPTQLKAALSSADAPDGSGVVIGVVDGGCDFAHPHFLRDGKTRLLALWDQRGGPAEDSPPEYGYGHEFEQADIDRVLTEHPPTAEDRAIPHRALGYEIRRNSHGTQVLDVAAGGGSEFGAPGVAPRADIIFVELETNQSTGTDESVGNSRRLLEGVKYIFDKAASLKRNQVVVNISLNGDGGPHDGSTLVEEAFDCLLETPGRAIVIAVGNSRDTRSHLSRTIHPNNTTKLLWLIPEKDQTSNKVEIWYDGRRSLAVRLVSPKTGQRLGPFNPGTTHTIRRQEVAAGHVVHRRHDPLNGDNHVLILFGPEFEPGAWTIELEPLDDEHSPFEVHAFIEKDSRGNRRSYFLETRRSDNTCTIGTLSAGRSAISVGAYQIEFQDTGLIVRTINPDSSEGPTRDGKGKPEVSAPGAGVRVAVALSLSVEESAGTSIAAPHVTGLIALLLQLAGKLLTIEQIRDLVINSSHKEPPGASNAWDSCFGVGRISGAAAVTPFAAGPVANLIEMKHEEVLIEEVTSTSITAVKTTSETVSVTLEVSKNT
jgi:subtilisin family serine protease